MEVWERQNISVEEASFDSGKIGGGVFAKSPLLSAHFLAYYNHMMAKPFKWTYTGLT
jgi:hypothetical protein